MPKKFYGKFKSKNDAMNRRISVWVCKTCETPHDKEILKIPKGERPTICIECRVLRSFYYFPSRAEAKYYAELRLQERAGIISRLHLQVAYPIKINSVPVTKYIADFVYWRNGQRVVEDVKGNIKFMDEVFKLKRKLVGAIYGQKINIIER